MRKRWKGSVALLPTSRGGPQISAARLGGTDPAKDIGNGGTEA